MKRTNLATPLLATLAFTQLACSDAQRGDAGVFGADSSVTTVDAEEDSNDEADANDGESPDSADDSIFDLGAGSEEAADDGCAESTLMATSVPSNVVLVLDYSSSMTQSIALFGDSRWAVLWDAVEYATSNYDAAINFGAVLFPDVSAQGNNSCVTVDVEVPVEPQNGATVMATIPPRGHEPPGNTPTRAGLTVASAHLMSLEANTPRALILVTDGEALCPEGQWAELTDDSVAGYVGDLAAQGIPTYVIGMANLGQSAREQLNDMATQSGVPNLDGPEQYYSASDLAQLEAAFDQVAGEVISCTIELEFAPPNPDYLIVEVDDQAIPYVADCQGQDGWSFVPDTDNLWIELCGGACATFKQDGTVHVVQECPPQG